MTDQDSGFDLRLSRRKLLATAGLAGGAALAPFTEAASAETPAVGPQPTPPVTGMHLQFGADASSQMSVSWHSLQPAGWAPCTDFLQGGWPSVEAIWAALAVRRWWIKAR